MLPHPHLPAIASLEDHRKTSQQLIARYVGFSSPASSSTPTSSSNISRDRLGFASASAASDDEDAASASWKAAAREGHIASVARVRSEVQRAKDMARPAASRLTRQRQRPGELRSSHAVSAPALLDNSNYSTIFSLRLRRRKLYCVVCVCVLSAVM